MLRKVKKIGLQTQFSSVEPVRKLILRVMALCLLPAQHISHTFELITTEDMSSLTARDRRNVLDLFRYIKAQWIDGVPPSQLSVFKLSSKTNNVMENINR